MSNRAKHWNNYIVLVDYNTPPRLKHNTAGRYRVGAKTPEEAKRLLRKAIGFGHIVVYYTCNEAADRRAGRFIGCGEMFLEKCHFGDEEDPHQHIYFMPVHHANDPIDSYQNAKPERIADYY